MLRESLEEFLEDEYVHHEKQLTNAGPISLKVHK